MPTTAPSDTRITLRLPRELQAQLEQSAKVSGVTLSEEMRQRLEYSLLGFGAPPQADEPTREFLDAARLMSDYLADMIAPWHEQRGAFNAFALALTLFLRRREPPGEPTITPKPDASAIFARRAPTVDNVARMLLAMADIPEVDER